MSGVDSKDDPLHTWYEYRACCFMRAAPLLAWYWTARQDFDLASAGLHLEGVTGARFDVGTHGLMISLPSVDCPDLQECHVVPLVRLSEASLDTLQPAAAFDLRARVRELITEQVTAQASLNDAVLTAHLWRLPMGGSSAVQ